MECLHGIMNIISLPSVTKALCWRVQQLNYNEYTLNKMFVHMTDILEATLLVHMTNTY